MLRTPNDTRSRRSPFGLDVAFAAALALAFGLGACGSSTPAPEAPTAPTEPSAAPSATPAATGAPTGGPAASGAPTSAPPAATPSGPSTPVQKSALLDDLKKAGINLATITPLEKIPLATKKKVMPLMQKSLGFDACTGCHVEGDFKKETRNMKIARQMWDHFVVGLRQDKANVFCDSCHANKQTVLNRGDKDAIKKFMETEYVGKFSRSDKKEHECSTCHGEAMELKIIDKLWAIPK
jgi:hypothetical protein